MNFVKARRHQGAFPKKRNHICTGIRAHVKIYCERYSFGGIDAHTKDDLFVDQFIKLKWGNLALHSQNHRIVLLNNYFELDLFVLQYLVFQLLDLARYITKDDCKMNPCHINFTVVVDRHRL